MRIRKVFRGLFLFDPAYGDHDVEAPQVAASISESFGILDCSNAFCLRFPFWIWSKKCWFTGKCAIHEFTIEQLL